MEAAEMTDAEFDETCWVTKRLDEDNPAVIYSFEVWSRGESSAPFGSLM